MAADRVQRWWEEWKAPAVILAAIGLVFVVISWQLDGIGTRIGAIEDREGTTASAIQAGNARIDGTNERIDRVLEAQTEAIARLVQVEAELSYVRRRIDQIAEKLEVAAAPVSGAPAVAHGGSDAPQQQVQASQPPERGGERQALAVQQGQTGGIQRISVKELEGMAVVGANGEGVGEVKKVLIQSGEPFAVIDSGGFLGLGEREVTVPLDLLTMSGDHLTLPQLTDQEIEQLVAAQPDQPRPLEGGEETEIQSQQQRQELRPDETGARQLQLQEGTPPPAQDPSQTR